jgi:hypothetical protein
MRKLFILTIIFLFIKPLYSQSIDIVKSFGGIDDDIATTIVTDDFGNIYIGGSFSDTVYIDNHQLISAGYSDMFLMKLDQQKNIIWIKTAGGIYTDFIRQIKIDNSGYIYITGSYNSPQFTFDTFTITNSGATDILIVKLDTAGNTIWLKEVGNQGYEWINDFFIDSFANLYLTGSFYSSTINFGNTTLTNVFPASFSDMFIVKLDSSGNEIWAKSAGGTNYDSGRSIIVDQSGNIFVAGKIQSYSFTFDTLNFSGNIYKLFILKLDSLGNLLWINGFGDLGDGDIFKLVYDGNNNLYFTGQFSGPMIIIGTDTLINSNQNYFDAFLVKMDTSGNILWSKQFGGNLDENGYALTIDNQGNIIGSIDFESPVIGLDTFQIFNNGTFNSIIYKTDPGGNVLNATNFGSTEIDYITDMTVDQFGAIFFTGSYSSPFLILNDTIFNKGSYDIVVAKLDFVTNISEYYSEPSKIFIYPNPTNSILNINYNSVIEEKIKIVIYDALGRIAFHKNYDSGIGINNLIVNLQKLSNGIYTLEFSTKDNNIREKVIINK